jgi:hypothetical protein
MAARARAQVPSSARPQVPSSARPAAPAQAQTPARAQASAQARVPGPASAQGRPRQPVPRVRPRLRGRRGRQCGPGDRAELAELAERNEPVECRDWPGRRGAAAGRQEADAGSGEPAAGAGSSAGSAQAGAGRSPGVPGQVTAGPLQAPPQPADRRHRRGAAAAMRAADAGSSALGAAGSGGRRAARWRRAGGAWAADPPGRLRPRRRRAPARAGTATKPARPLPWNLPRTRYPPYPPAEHKRSQSFNQIGEFRYGFSGLVSACADKASRIFTRSPRAAGQGSGLAFRGRGRAGTRKPAI